MIITKNNQVGRIAFYYNYRKRPDSLILYYANSTTIDLCFCAIIRNLQKGIDKYTQWVYNGIIRNGIADKRKEYKIMTKEIIEKFEGTVYKATLEYKKKERHRLEEAGYASEAEKTKASTYGYIQALCDARIITDRERMLLFIYYCTM